MSKQGFNQTVAALWFTKNGHLKSMKIDAKSYDQLQKALEDVQLGGMFFIKVLSEATRAKSKNPEKTPHAYLEVITKDKVDEYEKTNPRQRGERTI